MAKTDGIFIFVATYPDEAAAREDYQVVKDLHAGGLVGSYDAAVVTKDAKGKVHENKDETATRHGAWWGVGVGAAVGVIFRRRSSARPRVGGVVGAFAGHLAKGMPRSTAKELGDFIEPGQAGLLIVGETKVQAAVQKAVTRAEKGSRTSSTSTRRTSTRRCSKRSRRCSDLAGPTFLLLEQPLHLAEHGVPGVAEPLEEHHLRGDDLRAVLPGAVDRERLVGRVARADRVGDDDTRCPSASRPSTVCSTQMCASHPATTISVDPIGSRAGKSGSSRAENLVFASTASGYGLSGATVGPRPAGYCSVARTGTSSIRAACATRAALATTRSPSCIAGMSRSCRSIRSTTEPSAESSTPEGTPGEASRSTQRRASVGPERQVTGLPAVTRDFTGAMPRPGREPGRTRPA